MNNTIKNQQDVQDKPETTDKNKNSLSSGRKSGLDFRKYTQQIWLAGLGAFSRAEEEGTKLFDSLVKVGEELESKTVDIADQAVEKVSFKAKESVIDTKDKVEKLLDQGVNHSLNRLGLVTVKDIQHLEMLILQLHTKVDFLIEENKTLKSQNVKK
ncbi:MAG: phasin family protein [Acinetobacter harbinensis]|uniref:phasin family protein n=1 Tax=Acinetobacter TaxID=469 RepID=UPI00057C534C|nr:MULTISPECIES: phasin family protein [Acinetobacter]KWQ05018.1 poly(hydroxyalcanoate) granule associated protein [Acinetobacter harbinensis]MBR5557350.1 phasin family protein [Acinetobacter sp.]MDD2939164.1 phasin family protein [Acinetobacter harbinensis]